MIKFIIIFAVFGVLFYFCIPFRVLISHPFKTIYYAIIDTFNFIKYHKWNNCPYYGLICFQGLFGHGKTLSVVKYVTSIYDRYNDKKVYYNGKWVIQKVHILSNVNLIGYNYTYLSSLRQIVDFANMQETIDADNDIVTYTFVVIDEASVQLNSRNFKDNIDALFLNTLLTSRHKHINGIFTTSQKFLLQDKLLREVTEKVYSCKKVFRIMIHKIYDATDLEQCSDTTKIKPLRRTGWLINNSDYSKYDTLACVENLERDCETGAMLSETDILALQGIETDNPDNIQHKSFAFKRSRRKA